jgi:hypothetical protein
MAAQTAPGVVLAKPPLHLTEKHRGNDRDETPSRLAGNLRV